MIGKLDGITPRGGIDFFHVDVLETDLVIGHEMELLGYVLTAK